MPDGASPLINPLFLPFNASYPMTMVETSQMEYTNNSLRNKINIMSVKCLIINK
jgi:hypothetical protein